jgi:peptidase M28-like protein
MRWCALGIAVVCTGAALGGRVSAQAAAAVLQQGVASDAADPVLSIVARLDLEKYKATIKGLTQFGDRRQGTDRNRAAVAWIEAQLKSYGCANTERIRYDYQPPAVPRRRPPGGPRSGPGGSVMFGNRTRTSVNTDPGAQPDATLRDLNAQPTSPGPREEVFCTKVGTTHPGEMYIVGAHMDGHGWGEAANDDASGTALVMEIARVLSGADVQIDRSIRFALWNNEETGMDGAAAYVAQRAGLQGQEQPAGSGRYPEPRWLGMIQHDMMLFDHGMPSAEGKVSPDQRPEADVNVEFQASAALAAGAQQLAWALKAANEKYSTDYPAAVGPHMTNTDSEPFMNLVPAISVRENERGAQIGGGWDPHWHQPTDVFSTFSDKDFKLGLSAAQTTLGALSQLAGATLKTK